MLIIFNKGSVTQFLSDILPLLLSVYRKRHYKSGSLAWISCRLWTESELHYLQECWRLQLRKRIPIFYDAYGISSHFSWTSPVNFCSPGSPRTPEERGGRQALRHHRVDDVIRIGVRPDQDEGQGLLHRLEKPFAASSRSRVHHCLLGFYSCKKLIAGALSGATRKVLSRKVLTRKVLSKKSSQKES